MITGLAMLFIIWFGTMAAVGFAGRFAAGMILRWPWRCILGPHDWRQRLEEPVKVCRRCGQPRRGRRLSLG